MNRNRARGFTLIELMITVIIIGLLASIAYPAYQSQVRKTKRSEAKIDLIDTAQRLERCYTQFGAYNNDACTVKSHLSENEEYKVVISNLGQSTYTVTAVPNNTQQAKDTDCAEFSLDHTGLQLAEDSKGNKATDCW